MIRVYLSGPINSPIPGHTVADCKQAFEDLEKFLKRDHGYMTVVNPLKVAPNCDGNGCGDFDGHSWECWLKGDLKAMIDCEAIMLLPYWADSRGVRLEKYVADALGLKQYKAYRVPGTDDWTIKETREPSHG